MANFDFGDVNYNEFGISPGDIVKMLPHVKTKILGIHVYPNKNIIELSFATAAKTELEVKEWLQAYEDKTKCTYTIRTSKKCAGTFVQFKQQLVCHRNTRTRSIYDPTAPRQRTRNTNCPSSITIALRTVCKKYRGKDKTRAPNPDMPCEIRLIPFHNHATLSADALRFRAVSMQTRQTLMTYFENGHSPATARDSLKMEIQLKYDNHQEILADRSLCPDYMYIYHLYISVFKEKCGATESTREFLEHKIKEYNKEGNYAMIKFFEQDYVICLCPLLLKRVHENIAMASDIVFMDSTGTVDHDGSRIFILSTTSECGGLPLAVIITSSESSDLIFNGLELLKTIIGDSIFGGNKDGPAMFMTDDSAAEQLAIQSAFPKSTCLLCTFHVLRSVWRWLIKTTNRIQQEYQRTFFMDFRTIMYARDNIDCEMTYEAALFNAKNYPNYQNYLQKYWERRSLWALCYRNYFRIGHDTNNMSEAAMRLLKDFFFERFKAFNLLQVLDFMLTKFAHYCKRRLLDAAHNRPRRSLLYDSIKMPAEELLGQIEHLTDTIHLVPGENKNKLNVKYIVNSEVLVCTCDQGRTGYICKHIHWICFSVKSESFIKKISNEALRRKLYIIATGAEPPKGWLEPLFDLDASRQESERSSVVNMDCSIDNTHSFDEVNDGSIIEDTDELMIEGTERLNILHEKIAEYLKRSPNEVNQAIVVLTEKIDKMKTVAAFISACHSFSPRINRRGKRSQIPIQPKPTTEGKRKPSCGKRSIDRCY